MTPRAQVSPGVGKHRKWTVPSHPGPSSCLVRWLLVRFAGSPTRPLALWWRKGGTASWPLSTLGQVEAPFPLGLERDPGS